MTIDYACADEAAHVFAYWSDCLTFLRTLPDDWCHAVITDPPYGLADHKAETVAGAITAWAAGDRERVPDGRGFMGRSWDAFVPPPAVWDECLRVLKPGGHLAVFAGSRTSDLMGLSIRLAGFELRDGIAAWVYGSGFPKSLDVGKAIDKAAGAEREVVGPSRHHSPGRTVEWGNGTTYGTQQAQGKWETAPATDAAREWQGWGTALKPAHEPIILARKPLAGTVAQTVLTHGTGAIHVDACRVAHRDAADLATSLSKNPGRDGETTTSAVYGADRPQQSVNVEGRWPTNVILAHHPGCGPDEAPGPCVPGCQVAALDEQAPATGAASPVRGTETSAAVENGAETYGERARVPGAFHGDSGGASRFYPTFRYAAKAPKSERPQVDGRGHPTVKPLGLMRWLVRLLVPTEAQLGDGAAGLVLDPFAGSGTTLEAARAEGVRAVGVEADEHSCRLIAARLGSVTRPAPSTSAPAAECQPLAQPGAMTLFDELEAQVAL